MGGLFPINARLAQWLIPHFIRWGISANQITLLSLAAGLAGGWAFFQGTSAGMVWGALGFFAANLLDECDGSVARATGSSSGFGSWLDTLVGCAVHAAFFAGLGWGLGRQSAEPFWTWLGVLAAASVLIATAAYLIAQGFFRGQQGWIHPDPPRSTPPGRGEKIRAALRTDFSLVVLAAVAVGVLRWLIVGGLAGALLFWIPSDLFAAARQRQKS